MDPGAAILRRMPPVDARTLRRAGVVAAAALLAVVAAPAAGHTDVTSSSPADGAVVDRVPARVVLTFGQTIGGAGAMTLTRNGAGNLVKSARRDPRNARRVLVTLKQPGARKQAGRYRLSWRVSAPDGHAMRGVIAFRVRV